MRLIMAAFVCFSVSGGGVYGIRQFAAQNGDGSFTLNTVKAPAAMEAAARALGATGPMKFDFPNINPAAAYADVAAKLKSGELNQPFATHSPFLSSPMPQFNGAGGMGQFGSAGLNLPRR